MATIDAIEEEYECAEYSTGEGGENLPGDFNDLVGAKTSDLDELFF